MDDFLNFEYVKLVLPVLQNVPLLTGAYSWRKAPVFLKEDGSLAPKKYTRDGIAFPGHSPFTSFVHGLSFTEAPLNATKGNFFLPMAVYLGKSLYSMAGQKAPSMLSIIFDEDNPSLASFYVSVTPTYAVGTTLPKHKRQAMQLANHQWMRSHALGFENPHTSYINPEGRRNGGQLFGHCAETHAYVIKLL